MTDLLVKLIELTGGAAGWLIIVFICLGGVAGYVVGMIKSRREISNLEQQILGSVAEQEQRAQDIRRIYTEEVSKCREIASQLIQACQANTPPRQLHEMRESFCTVLSERVIPEFLNLVSTSRIELDAHLSSVSASTTPDDYVELIDEAIDELLRFRRWLTIINHPNFVRVLNLSSLSIQRRWVSPFIRNVRRLPKGIRNAQVARAEEAVAMLVSK